MRRVCARALRSIFSLRGNTDDDDPMISGRVLFAFATVSLIATVAVLGWRFAVPVFLSVILIVVAGLIQNIIATRAAAQAAFNPARVMGILLQGVASLVGGSAASVNLAGAGYLAAGGPDPGPVETVVRTLAH